MNIIEHVVTHQARGESRKIYRAVCSCGWRQTSGSQSPELADELAMREHGVASQGAQLAWEIGDE